MVEELGDAVMVQEKSERGAQYSNEWRLGIVKKDRCKRRLKGRNETIRKEEMKQEVKGIDLKGDIRQVF